MPGADAVGAKIGDDPIDIPNTYPVVAETTDVEIPISMAPVMYGIVADEPKKVLFIKNGLMGHIPAEQLRKRKRSIVYPFIAWAYHIAINNVKRVEIRKSGKVGQYIPVVQAVIAAQEKDPPAAGSRYSFIHSIVDALIGFRDHSYPVVLFGVSFGD